MANRNTWLLFETPARLEMTRSVTTRVTMTTSPTWMMGTGRTVVGDGTK